MSFRLFLPVFALVLDLHHLFSCLGDDEAVHKIFLGHGKRESCNLSSTESTDLNPELHWQVPAGASVTRRRRDVARLHRLSCAPERVSLISTTSAMSRHLEAPADFDDENRELLYI